MTRDYIAETLISQVRNAFAREGATERDGMNRILSSDVFGKSPCIAIPRVDLNHGGPKRQSKLRMRKISKAALPNLSRVYDARVTIPWPGRSGFNFKDSFGALGSGP